jgi:hypothetical protein
LIKSIFVLMGLWFANQVFTDIYRGTAAQDWMRGDAAIVFFASNLAFLVVLLGQNERRKVVFLGSFAIGSLLAAVFQPLDSMADDPWKFGYSTGANLLAFLLCGYLYQKRSYLLTGIILSSIAAANLFNNFRSPVLGILMAVALTTPILPERIGRIQLLPRKGTLARVAVLCAVALGTGALALGLVRLATDAGFITADAQAKNKLQSESGSGILLAGRPEILVSSRALLEHPIVGFGSWARDFKYVEMLSDIQARFGIETDLQDDEANTQGLIPTHSHLMGAWVWAGILGAAFWAYIFWLTLRATVRLASQPPKFVLLYAWLIPGMIWAILFSPFGLTMRISDAVVIVAIVDLLERAAHGPQAVPEFQRLKLGRFNFKRRQPVLQRSAAVRQIQRGLPSRRAD